MPRTILVTLLYIALIGVLAWAIVAYVPMPGPFATLVIIVAVIAAICLAVRLLPPP